jgi:hypothetical protein
MGFAMKRWIIFVLLAIFLSIPAVSGAAAGDLYDSGKATVVDVPFFKIPIGSTLGSKADKEKKEGEEAKNDATKEKEKQDKKVDDALKKAWGE